MAPKQPDRPQILASSLPDFRLTMDPEAFEHAIKNFGIPMVHYRAMRCPVGLIDPNDVRRGHEHHAHCQNGFLYEPMGKLMVVPTSNSADPRLLDVGFITGSVMQVTFSKSYIGDPACKTRDNQYAYILPYDRFYVDDPTILVATWELMQAHETRIDKPKFPAVRVQHLIDSHGVKWDSTSFDVLEGNITWKPNQGPASGTVYTIWYEYRPHWYVKNLVHEIRITPVVDYMDANKMHIRRAPFAAVLQRENVFRNEENDPDMEGSPRNQPRPADESFGAR